MGLKNHSAKSNKTLGAFGESAVVDFVTAQGSTVIDRNWRIKEGEIDIVARVADGTISFIEVKTRSSSAYGHPLESIGVQKAHRLQRLALAWLATHQCLGSEFHIDCAAVLISPNGGFSIEYRANVL